MTGAQTSEPGGVSGLSVPGLDFTAVDFETANGFRGSPCSIGLVKVRDGREAETLYTVMRPPEGFDRFDPKNVAIHGITADAVAGARRFGELFTDLLDFIGGDPLVAHNASFDIEVFESALEVSGLDSPGLRCHCSVQLSRAVYDLPSHALPKSAAEAGFLLQNHHHALEDAQASAAIVCDIARRREMSSLEGLSAACGIPAEELEPWNGQRQQESRATAQVRQMAYLFDSRTPHVDPEHLPDLMRWQDEGKNLPPALDADPGHLFYGQSFVFTGNLAISRGEAKRLVAQHGGAMSSKVNGSTTILVVGDGFDLSELSEPGTSRALGSNKAREARRRIARGQALTIMSEPEFRAALGVAWPVGNIAADGAVMPGSAVTPAE